MLKDAVDGRKARLGEYRKTQQFKGPLLLIF